MNTKESKTVVIIGAGVLSTTFGSMLKEIEPNWNIKLYERLDRPGLKVLMNVIMPELAMLLYVN